MAELPFWIHPDASTEVLAIHDHYFDVARSLAEDFQAELERSQSVIARCSGLLGRLVMSLP